MRMRWLMICSSEELPTTWENESDNAMVYMSDYYIMYILALESSVAIYDEGFRVLQSYDATANWSFLCIIQVYRGTVQIRSLLPFQTMKRKEKFTTRHIMAMIMVVFWRPLCSSQGLGLYVSHLAQGVKKWDLRMGNILDGKGEAGSNDISHEKHQNESLRCDARIAIDGIRDGNSSATANTKADKSHPEPPRHNPGNVVVRSQTVHQQTSCVDDCGGNHGPEPEFGL